MIVLKAVKGKLIIRLMFPLLETISEHQSCSSIKGHRSDGKSIFLIFLCKYQIGTNADSCSCDDIVNVILLMPTAVAATSAGIPQSHPYLC